MFALSAQSPRAGRCPRPAATGRQNKIAGGRFRVPCNRPRDGGGEGDRMIQDIKVKIAERLLKKDDKEKNYALHIVGTIVIVALALTALTFWFPIS